MNPFQTPSPSFYMTLSTSAREPVEDSKERKGEWKCFTPLFQLTEGKMEGRDPCRQELKDGREKGKDGQGLAPIVRDI